jgi:hypothetical protein
MIRMTRITSEFPAVTTKQYHLDETGELKLTPGGVVCQANLETLDLGGLEEMGNIIDGLDANQALIYGLPRKGVTKITTKRMALQGPLSDETGTRSKDTFSWSASYPGVMMIDYDPGEDEEVLDREGLVSLIREVVPGLKDVKMLWVPSASSMIYNTDTGEQIYGIRGQRLYIAVEDPVGIHDAGQILFDRLWLAGHGRIELSANGSFLTRGPCDTSVWSPERLDFAGGSLCHPPLEQRRGSPVVIEGEVEIVKCQEVFQRLDNADRMKLDRLRGKARKDMESEAKSRRSQYLRDNHRQMFTEDEENSYEALDNVLKGRVLTQNFLITLDDNTSVSVQQILDNRTKYNGRLCYDPVEPSYQGGKVIGKLYLSGANPVLSSFAHGKTTYTLTRRKRLVDLSTSDDATNRGAVLEILRQEEDVFEFASLLAVIEGDRLCTLDNNTAAGYLNRFFLTTKTTKKGDPVPVQIPDRLIRDVLSLKGGARELKPLKGVVDIPTMCPNGRMLETPGYDRDTELYFCPANGMEIPPVPSSPTDEDVKNAVKKLMSPFREFPLGSEDDKSVLLAALLTAVCRPVLDVAPGFVFNSSVSGAGKTLAASTIGALATGVPPAATTAPENEEEWRKKIFASLVATRSVMFVDNVYGTLRSSALDSILTNGSYQDRVLGASKELEIPVRCLWMITGNAMALSRDLARRLLTCNIHPEEDEVEVTKRRFDFNPVAEVRENRTEMIFAANVLLRAGFDRKPKYVPLSGFDEWGSMVLASCEVVRGLDKSFGDPRACVDEAREEATASSGIEELLDAIKTRIGIGVAFTADDLMDYAKMDADVASVGGRVLKDKGEGTVAYTKLETIAPSICGRSHLKDVSNKTLGHSLRNRMNIWSGDLQLRRSETRSKVGRQYYLKARGGALE